MANLDMAGIITRACTDLKAKFSKVTVTRDLTSGTKSATLTVDNINYNLYTPTPPTNVSELTNDSDYINSEYLTNNFQTILRDTERESFYAADSTTGTIIFKIFGKPIATLVPSDVLNALYYVALVSNNRYSLIWVHDTTLEIAPIHLNVDMTTQTPVLYAIGRYSIAYGTLGVDSSWTIEALSEDAEGKAY